MGGPLGEWQLGRGVIHRVNRDDMTVTVQFLPDQHRCRLPWMSVRPIPFITPTYPTVKLAPGQRLPSRYEIEQREERANRMRQDLSIPHDALRNRSIPASQVTGEYRKHFYTNLYKNNFYV